MRVLRGIAGPVSGALAVVGLIGGGAWQPASAENEPEMYVHHAYTSQATNETFYQVYLTGADGSRAQRVIFRTADGAWEALPETVLYIGGSYGSPTAAAWTRGLTPPPFDEVYYDAEADELVAEARYSDSPNGKFGLRYVMYFDKVPAQGGFERGYGYDKRIAALRTIEPDFGIRWEA